MPRLSPGDRFARYRIESLISEGATTAVYRAQDTLLHRRVALKVVRPREAPLGADNEDDVAPRVLREARAAAALRHPNAVAIFDVGEVDGIPFIAMELVRGKTLRAYVGDEAIPVERKIGWLLDVARVLGVAHAAGLAHREIKPENVIVCDDGSIKVLDFGIAGETDAQSSGMDQLAWAAMAYELLSGKQPAGRRAEALPNVSPEVAAVIARALAPEPQAGSASMDDIVSQLAPHVAHAEPRAVAAVSGGQRRSVRSKRLRAAVAALAVGVFLVMGAVALQRGKRNHRATDGGPAPAATPITSLPLPSSTNREALAAYVESIQAIRDGAGRTARERLKHALDLDPTLAPAQLRLTIFLVGQDDEQARESFRRSLELRSRLTERDQGFLDALEPEMARSPGDPAEATRRFQALSDHYPGDAEIAFELAIVQSLAGDFQGSVASAKRALTLDPDYLLVLGVLGDEQAYLGDFDGGLQTLQQCMERSGAATTCAVFSGEIFAVRGECEAAAETSRRVRASTPSTFGYSLTVEAAIARGEPATVLQRMLDQQGADAPWELGLKRFRLSAFTGDFVAAEKAARDMEDALAHDAAAERHVLAACDRLDIYAETGRLADAGETARKTLDAMHQWEPEARIDDDGIAHDRTPRFLAEEVHAGLLTREAMIEKRRAWLAAWEAKVPSFYRGYLWVQAYSETVETADDAREALDALPRYGGIPPYRSEPFSVGKIYWLAGRLDEAVPLLRAEARACNAYRSPFERVRASFFLGRALEDAGKTEEACDAYEAVRTRWGRAAPGSTTAEQARRRARMLGCRTDR